LLMKNVIDDLIATLDPDAPVRDIRQGVFHTAVVTRNCGLAATLPRDALRQAPPLVREPGSLHRKSAEELAGMAHSPSILEAAVGMAAINSLLEVDEGSCRELNAAELIMQKGEGKKIAIVGHFPFVGRVRKKAKELWVIEKNPGEGDFEESRAASLIPEADVVALTGTSITNHSLEELLALCLPSAFVLMLGDTTPLSPVLFDHGLDALCGTRVADTGLVLSCVSQGANFRQILGTKRLTMLK
jgi:uncharacterized protein